MLAVAGIAVGLGLWRSVRPMLGLILFFALVQSGISDTRIGRELAYVIVHTLGVPGLNTSGRPGDDPLVGWENFPWLLLSLTTITLGLVAAFFAVRATVRRPEKEPPERGD
jgi:hypothetical protein